MSNSNFKPGDIVCIKREPEHMDYARNYGIPLGPLTVASQGTGYSGGLMRFEGGFTAYARRFERVEESAAAAQASPPRSTSIQAVKVPKADSLDVLTAYVRDTLGLDAEVARAVRGSDSYELVFIK